MRTPGGNARYVHGSLLALLTASLCGCSTVGGPQGKEAAAIQQNHQTIVLARICADDAHGEHGPNWPFTLLSWQLRDGRGEMKNPQASKEIFPRAVSKSSRDDGWFYFVMDPGSYCLRVTHQESPITILTRWDTVPDSVDEPVLYFSVPADKPFVYAGTLVFNRQTEKEGGEKVTWCVPSHVADDSATARSVTAGQFPGLGEMTSSLLLAYSAAGINSNEVVNVETSPAASRRPPPTIQGVDWLGASMIEAPAGDAFESASDEESPKDAGNDALGGMAWFLLTAPIALGTEGITAHAHQKKWAPYEAGFQKQVAAFHPEDKFQQAFANRLNLAGTNSTPSPSLHLEVQPYNILLRGDRHQKFNLEVAARVRLLSSTDARTVWEHDFLCTYNGPDSSAAGDYQTLIPCRYGQHRLEEYRGDAGAGLMQRELESAVGAITDEVVGELYAESAASSSNSPVKNVATAAETRPQSPP